MPHALLPAAPAAPQTAHLLGALCHVSVSVVCLWRGGQRADAALPRLVILGCVGLAAWLAALARQRAPLQLPQARLDLSEGGGHGPRKKHGTSSATGGSGNCVGRRTRAAARLNSRKEAPASRWPRAGAPPLPPRPPACPPAGPPARPPRALLHLLARLQAHGRVRAVAQRVHADRERALGRKHARDLALELGLALTDERGVVDEAVLGRLVLGLQRPARRQIDSMERKQSRHWIERSR
jgi:hypothetical protein